MKNYKFSAGIILTIIFIFGLLLMTAKYKCEDYQLVTGKQTTYNFMTCYVKVNNEWLTMKQYNSTLRATKIETK